MADKPNHRLTRWEWEGEAPSRELVLEALDSLPPVWGVETVNHAAHVLPMAQKVTRYFDADGNPVPIKSLSRTQQDVPVWKLYMQVAGRLAMLNEAAEAHKWRVEFVPDSVTMTRDENSGVMPAYLLKNVIVYRETLVIWTAAPDARILGRRPGMSALKTGGFVPPWEKMETAARGRALGAWGFGVLPGSGIASLDEMEISGPDYYPAADEVEKIDRSREDIEADLRTGIERLRVVRDRSQEEMAKMVQAYALEISGITPPIKKGVLDLAELGLPHLELLRRRVEANLKEVRSQTQ